MKTRTITALLALAVFLPFIIIGHLPFTLFIYAMATIGFLELIRMRKIGSYLLPLSLGILLIWMMLLPTDSGFQSYLIYSKVEVFMLFVMLLLAYTVLVKNKFTFDDAGFVLLAVVYVTVGFYYLIETRHAPEGLWNVFFAFFIIWATDTGAYLFGKLYGNRKLWPDISPNKTVEGAAGGVLLAVVVAFIFHLVHPFPYNVWTVIVVTVFASLIGQIGDLVESAFKRHYGVKDSGNILPGHGGILDRFDSLLFVLPFLHFVQFF
jgi:phosphatidate cytidylyltransferase